MEMYRNLLESSSPSNSKNDEKTFLIESPRRRRIEGTARAPFFGTLPEEEWEFIKKTTRIGQDLVWIELPSWKRSGR